MSDDAKDEMAKRFEIDEPDNTDAASDSDTMADTATTQHATDTDNASNTDDSGGSGDAVRDRRQIPMYLPEPKAERIQETYDELDARSKLAGEGGIEKHKDFFEGFVEAALDNDELAEYVGVSDDE